MPQAYKLDRKAYSNGVSKVLTMKPLVKVVAGAAARQGKRDSQKPSTGAVSASRRKQ